jgi:hypothetical protein
MVMEDRPHKFVAKMMNAVMRGMIRKAVSSDLDAVKEFCEKPGAT